MFRIQHKANLDPSCMHAPAAPCAAMLRRSLADHPINDIPHIFSCSSIIHGIAGDSNFTSTSYKPPQRNNRMDKLRKCSG
eukprot:6162446-Pleurochrysis_carterae.AAC.2